MTREQWLALITMRNMNPRDRRAVLIGAAVLAPALLYIAAVRPYRAELADLRDRTTAEQRLLEREEALLALAPVLPNNVQALEQVAQRAERRLVHAANVPLAEAEVTSMLEQIATLSRVLLQEMSGVDTRRRGRADADSSATLRKLQLALQGESDLEGVLTFLHRIETNPLLMRVVALTIEPVYEGNAQDRAATGVVRFTLTVEAYAPADIDRTGTPEEVSS